MRTGFCRYCKIELYNDHDYFGYCSIGCCVEFAHEQNITIDEAKDLGFPEKERNDLEDRIAQIECDYDNVSNECGELYRDLDKAEEKIWKLKDKVEELESVDWEEVKKERRRESEYNESVLRKVSNIKRENDRIKEQMDKVKRDNILLKDQNLELLNSIKEIKSHSDRFELLDLGIELEYDE
jgi:chromosome segregation ATPase